IGCPGARRSNRTARQSGAATARDEPGAGAGGAGVTAGLRAEGLTVEFGGLVAVHDLTLDAPLGRVTGLIGPNGAGKSTTFNACSGLVRPTHGTVELLGHDGTRLA